MTPRRNSPAPFATPPIGEWFNVKITAGPTAGDYEFDEWMIDGSGTAVVKPGGRVATADNPARAITGTLAVGDFALARAAPGAGGFLYELAPPGPTGPAGGTIQVEDVDESPSVSSVAQLRFDSADGFVVSTPGAGVARVDLQTASPTQNGIVDNGLTTVPNYVQCWEGSKYVVDTTFSSWFEMGICNETFYAGGTLGDQQRLVFTGASIDGEFVVRPSVSHRVGGDPGGSDLSLQFDAENQRVILAMTQFTDSPGIPAYCVYDPGTPGILEGITGTRTVKDGSGNNKVVTISGGIITDWET